MSEDQKYGEASVQADQGFTPMSDAYAPPVPEPAKEYSSDMDGIKEVARDLEDERRRRRGQPDDAPIPRTYAHIGGDRHGEAAPENETITLERASDDLTRQRAFEQAAQQPMQAEVANAIDQARNTYAQLQQPTEAQSQPQPEQPEAPAQQTQQPQHDQQQGDVHPDVLAALQNEHVRAALAKEIAQVEEARAQFATAARTAAQLSAAALFSNEPHLANLSAQELPHTLSAIAKVNPQKAMEIQAQLQRTQQLWQASEQAEAQRAAIQEQRVQQWAAQEDAKFEAEIAKENPATVKAVKEQGAKILTEDYNIDPAALGHLLKTTPALRSAEVSRIIYDAIRYRIAQRDVVNKVDRSAPPVQRPGVAAPHRNNDHIDAALKQFRSEPSVANAAKLLQARRSSR
jgi:hypothetical protein